MASTPISQNGWSQIVEKVGDEISAWYTNFANHFNKVPNENGLTDMFLYNLSTNLQRATGGASTIRLMDVTAISQRLEGTVGYDYCWEFHLFDNFTSNVNISRRIVVYLQAKVLSPLGNNNWDAGFTYKTKNNGLQMNILDTFVKKKRAELKAQDPNVWVVGGYILYGPEHTKYISVRDVLKINGSNDKQSDPIDRRLATEIPDRKGRSYLPFSGTNLLFLTSAFGRF